MLINSLSLTEFALSESLNEIPPIPWDVLNSAKHHSMLLTDSKSFSSLTSLNPYCESMTEMYDILNLITNAQEEEHYVLECHIW